MANARQLCVFRSFFFVMYRYAMQSAHLVNVWAPNYL